MLFHIIYWFCLWFLVHLWQVLNEIYTSQQSHASAERYLNIIKGAMSIPESRESSFPLTYYHLTKYVDMRNLTPELIHIDACPGDKECVLFRNDLAEAKECPVCSESRYDEDGRPRRTAYYFSLKDLFKRAWNNPVLAEWMHYASER